MGFTPQQIDGMSMWQFMAAAEGFARANDPKVAERLTEGEKDDLAAWLGISGSNASLDNSPQPPEPRQ